MSVDLKKNYHKTFIELTPVIIKLHNLFLAMFSSTTYADMFRELMSSVYEDGVITRDWCEVPIQKWHILQVKMSPF